jgi:hypothetical protein
MVVKVAGHDRGGPRLVVYDILRSTCYVRYLLRDACSEWVGGKVISVRKIGEFGVCMYVSV